MLAGAAYCRFPQRVNSNNHTRIMQALRCDSPAKGASERSEAAPSRELAQHKALFL